VRLIIDQDEVICRWVERILEWWNKDNGTNLTVDDITNWDVTSCLPHDGKYFIRSCMRYPELYRDLDPVDGAISGISQLISDGHDVIIATAAPPSAGVSYAGKLEWLRRNMGFFNLKNFIAIARKDLLMGDILLDDGEHNIDPWVKSGRIGVIFDRPWNRKYHGATARVKSWEEFIELVNIEKNSKS
jgi:5'-nucleotidase